MAQDDLSEMLYLISFNKLITFLSYKSKNLQDRLESICDLKLFLKARILLKLRFS